MKFGREGGMEEGREGRRRKKTGERDGGRGEEAKECVISPTVGG